MFIERPALFSDGHGDSQRLAETANDAAEEDNGGDKHQEPANDNPVCTHALSGDRHRNTRAGDAVKSGQGGLAVGNGVSAELDLHEDLDDAAENDEPQEREARLRTGGGGGNQFTRADQRAREHKTG